MHPPVLKSLILSCCLLLLTQCSKVVEIQQNTKAEIGNPYLMPAATSLALAENQTGEARQSLKLKAAGRLIQDGRLKQARLILTRLQDLSPKLQDEKHLLLAKIELMREGPKSAISWLTKVGGSQNLSLYQQIQYHKLLAEAYESNGNAIEAVNERIKLGELLPDAESREKNYRALWLNLAAMPASELNTLALEAEDNSAALGWINLALVSKHDYQNPHAMISAIMNWRRQFSNHPAASLIPLETAQSRLFAAPRQMALLLPLSGPLAGPGGAIRDGFMAALEGDAKKDKAKVLFYDTNSNDASFLYQKAVNDGAQFVVGPLLKNEVQKVALLNHPVPTVLLNDLEYLKHKGNSYQFGLSPSIEARQVAVKARKAGLGHALIIAPAGEWGDDVAAAFAAEWQGNGGRIVDTLRYRSNDNLNTAIRDFLHITDSELRKKQLQKLLQQNIAAVPRRRQDFDMIFLLAYPGKARQIMPLLKYYYAGDIPVYATSSVYAGHLNPLKDRDLNGIIFCDMPWVFTHHMGNKNWPEWLNSYNRLYALGMDSYALSKQLNQLQFFPALGIKDKSGVLYLNPDGKISRILAWGQFKQGMANLRNQGRIIW